MINLQLEVNDVNTVLQGLGELPAKLSMNVIQLIQAQAATQMQPDMVSAEEEE